MSVEHLKIAARKHIQGITTTHPALALPSPFLSENVRSTSLASLVEKLNVSASAKSTLQVRDLHLRVSMFFFPIQSSKK